LQKRESYLADITYVSSSEIVFDYLKDYEAFSKEGAVLRPLNYALIDEIDSILLDEAHIPLVLADVEGTITDNAAKLNKINATAKNF